MKRKPSANSIGVTRAERTKLDTATVVLDSIAAIQIANPTKEQRYIMERFLEARQHLKAGLAMEGSK